MEVNIWGVPKPARLRNKVDYEWRVEVVEVEYGDIVDTVGHDSLAKALEHYKSTPDVGHRHELVLVRDYGNAWSGVVDRQWAYVEDGVLPAEFTGGDKVPAAYLAEFAQQTT